MADVSKKHQEQTPTSTTSNVDNGSVEHATREESLDEDVLNHLAIISRKLRHLGTINAMQLLTVFSCVVLSGVLRAVPVDVEIRIGVAVSGIIFAFLGFFVLYIWDRCVESGMVLYEEISDEVEWEHRTFRHKVSPEKSDSSQKRNRPNFKTRVALRKFLNSTKLPLTPDRRGSVGYIIVYVICIIAIVVLLPSYYS